tara:strand:+ start:733 stop:1110 length:378 start_codon:yes stop_codon:yes gene_type:complete
MAHFAKLDENNIVTQVIVVSNDIATSENAGVTFINNLYGTIDTWKQTSFNTIANNHKLGGTPFRKNYAGINFTYDASRDAFIPPKPYASWVLVDATCQWKSPVDYPDDDDKRYVWNEDNQTWEER